MKRCHHALDRIVEQNRADADLDIELEVVRISEERLVLKDRFPLVIKHSPTAPNPTRTDLVRCHFRLAIRIDDDLTVGVARGNGSRLGLNFVLDLATEPV